MLFNEKPLRKNVLDNWHSHVNMEKKEVGGFEK